ncbi:hypothetical protein IWW39_003437 [Coemansia spiralis]|uniref:HIRAN domain-containing protein n=1 Tax=Coemansia spiralis TaxID=417178 RepID=A0A9W8GL91_9FUNG|nr:hypothetical protein IWW39_003437 [Coemansia spiralis]
MLACYGQFNALVVGRRYYTAQTTINENLDFLREQFNPYDSNAIGIYSLSNEKLGHLPRWLAAALAPCMDSAQCKLCGSVSGEGNPFVTPIRVKLYAPVAMAQVVRGLLGTYWQMWELAAPPVRYQAELSCSDELREAQSGCRDFGNSADLADSDASADLARDVYCAFGKQKLLVISTVWGICDWVRYATGESGGKRGSWVVYTCDTPLKLLESSQAVFVSVADAPHVLARTGHGYWSKIAVDKTAIGNSLNMGSALTTMLDARTTLYV